MSRKMVRTLIWLEILLATSHADARHEGLHPLVLLVVARDDPHHAQRVHHAGQRVDDLQQRAVQDVLEVALECGEELDVVLGLDVTLLKLAWRAVAVPR